MKHLITIFALVGQLALLHASSENANSGLGAGLGATRTGAQHTLEVCEHQPAGATTGCARSAIRIESLGVRELHMSDVQWARVHRDLPISDVLIDETPALWFIGKRSLWFWNPQSGALSEISLDKELKSSEELRFITSNSQDLILASLHYLFRVSFDPLAIKIVGYEPNGVSLGLSSQNGETDWILSNSIYRLTSGESQLAKRVQPLPTELPENSSPILAGSNLWYKVGNDLFCRNLIKQSAEKVFSTQNPLLHFSAQRSSILLHSPYALLHLNGNGQLLRTIPVVGKKRRLVMMEIKDDRHLFVFSDQHIEIKIPQTQKSFYSLVSIGRVEKAQLVRSRGSILAMILDEQIRAFQLDGRWDNTHASREGMK